MATSSPENITEIIEKPPEEYPPEPRYVSKYREQIIEASKRGKSAHRTMGVPPMDPDMPAQYLKQRSATEARWKALEKKSKSPEREKRTKRREQKVSAPKKSPKAPKISRPNRAKRGLWCVDDRHGNSYPVMLSGMYPVYRNREGFGKVPGTYVPDPKFKKRNTLEQIPSVVLVEKRKTRELEKSPRRGRSPGRSAQLKKKEIQRATKTRDRSPKAQETRNNKRIQEATKKLQKNQHQSPKRSMVQKKGRHSEKTKQKHPEAGKRSTVARKVTKSLEVHENEEKTSLQDQDDQEADRDSQKKEREHEKDEESEKHDESTSSKSEVESKGTRASEDNSSESTSSRGSSKSGKTDTSTTTASTASYHHPRCRYVDEDERAELLYGMKKKWDEMMNKFQCLPFVTDTQPKKKRKSRMEKDLMQLEKDIKMIEAHPYIYVYSDPED